MARASTSRAAIAVRDPGRLRLLRERPRDSAAVEAMNEAAFGPDRQQKTVYRLREDVPPIRELCFVAIDQKDRMVASIRNWPIMVNETWPAILLGPLAISPELRGLGYGKALMWHAMAQSRMLGHSRIILVGDPEYYNQFGFRRDLALNIQLPGWVEERRFLALELVAGSMIGVHGMIGKWEPKKRASRRKKR
jgi:predicted N-acetyltransferase YhbS